MGFHVGGVLMCTQVVSKLNSDFASGVQCNLNLYGVEESLIPKH